MVRSMSLCAKIHLSYGQRTAQITAVRTETSAKADVYVRLPKVYQIPQMFGIGGYYVVMEC